jgi:hypothetical protein
LPNGTIVAPSGQVVGQAVPPASVNPASTLLNPYDQFTATASVDKYLDRGLLSFSTSVQRDEYETNSVTPDYTAATFTGRGAFWVGPMFYLYSNGTFSDRFSSSAYRAVGGIGSRQIGVFQASVYGGEQGSQSDDSSSAGGEVYGGQISYYPIPFLTFTAKADESVNIASQGAVSSIAQSLPGLSPLLIPESTSTRVTSTSLISNYRMSPQWVMSGTFSYQWVNYVDSPRLDHSWVVDAYLSYDIWRNMTLIWEYQFSAVDSNTPMVGSNRNYVSMSALYKF